MHNQRGQSGTAELPTPGQRKNRASLAWRDELYARGVLDRDAKSPREEFKRVRMQLQVRSLIGVNGELVWKV